ncbi:unnamed protein product [Urochloa decumbens]|uniref:SIAH-type domain-containing protein n=1 Tax=Urochloa decumbens TaxID=240449 RepID=A0ABC8W5V2_9POAL
MSDSRTTPTGGREPKRKRSAPLDGGVASSSSAMAPPDLTVADADALDCGVCYLPLKPPIFQVRRTSRAKPTFQFIDRIVCYSLWLCVQCDVGHVLCAACRDKLNGKGKCYVCGVAMAGGYRRCHAMERVVDSIRGPCPNAAYGCDAMPAYHGREKHRWVCPHAPCHCPGKACGFAGSTAALLDHFRAAHNWPCTTEVEADARGEYTVRLHDGFNFLLTTPFRPEGQKMPQGATQTVHQCLLLLNVVRQPLARNIFVICIDPRACAAAAGGGQGPASKEIRCTLSYFPSWRGGDRLLYHHQISRIGVACTDLSNGMPQPDCCFQLPLLRNPVVAGHLKDNVEVKVRIGIN